ncbi:MAG: SufD family Fe-S cluster assembly protein [Spirochaetia bacterium]|nr:SufD family Fe-S cluster assembly protein [Spirochaetia bacterium]
MAKITIQKKIKTNPFEELSKLLNTPELESVYPHRQMEPWRRFDPAKLLPAFAENLQNGITMSSVKIAESSESGRPALNSAAKWKSVDEIFLQKARNNLKLFKKTEATEFFENFISKSVSDEHLHILKLSKNETCEQIPVIEISPVDENKLHVNIIYIYCEEFSNATINIIKKPGSFDLTILYIFQEKKSRLQLRHLDENNRPSQGVNFLKYHQEDGSISKSGIYNLCNSQSKKVFVESNLRENSSAEFMGIFLGRYSNVDHDFLVNHLESFSKSNLLFKMSVMDDSYGVFWGNADIVAGTRGCEAYQQNKNLILGNHSRVDAIPRLGIHTENVIAAHGSATGEISEEEVFYMMSRGLSYAEARKLLLRGFFEDVLRKSFEHDVDEADAFLERIWKNIQNILGVEISV